MNYNDIGGFMKREITYKSKDNKTDIHAIIWEPIGEIKGILQISHGMIENISRYENFAMQLNKNGILVCGNDHLGHGLSVIDKKHYGYFTKNNGDKVLVDDLYSLTEIIKQEYPNIPYFILGHSMGSFILRNYIRYYGTNIDGAIIVGSGYKNKVTINTAILVTNLIAKIHLDEFYRSEFIYKMTTGNYWKYFKEGKTNKNCWLTKNEEVIAEFGKNPLMDFKFTCNGYKWMFKLIKNSCDIEFNKKINKDLPLFILSGDQDPVGNFGKDIEIIKNMYKDVGIKYVDVKLYKDMRHEILNEVNNSEVILDIVSILNEKKI